jgi:putative ABC transport system permease protein
MEFIELTGLAFLIALPASYLVMRRWLEAFAYRIELGPGLFLAAGAVALGIALLTVSYQSIKAAVADPVESLRYE